MRVIDPSVHGLLDYLLAVLLLAGPYLFGYYGNAAAVQTSAVAGLSLLVYSSCTCYRRGLLHLIGFPLHLVLDIVAGVILATAPWVFHFHRMVYLPHLVLGTTLVLSSLTTRINELTLKKDR